MEKFQVIIVDVYETMLDMSEVERKVNYLLDSKRGYLIWNQLFMQYCFVDNCLRDDHNFLDIGRATLRMAGQQLGRTITVDQANAVLELLKHVPLHEDVREALSGFRDMGLKIGALTNASRSVVMERMDMTGLVSYFEKVMTSDDIQMYKPCAEVYQWALKELEAEAGSSLMISSHAWDLAGAANAGMATAYVRSKASSFYDLAPQPMFVCSNFTELFKEMELLSIKPEK